MNESKWLMSDGWETEYPWRITCITTSKLLVSRLLTEGKEKESRLGKGSINGWRKGEKRRKEMKERGGETQNSVERDGIG